MSTYTDPESIGLRVKTPEEVRATLAELRERLEGLYGERLCGLYLFGSYARGGRGRKGPGCADPRSGEPWQ